MFIPSEKFKCFRSFVVWLIVVTFTTTFFTPVPKASAQSIPLLNLPMPGTMVNLSQAFTPVLLRGLKVYPQEPLKFDFIVDTGNSELNVGANHDLPLEKECEKIIKYFLAALTVPEDDLWVNLSPYEKDRIIPESFGQTEMGRDMLAQDYILKQLTASLMYPEKELGKNFWDRVYKKAREQFGTTEIPMDTFNKVWIVPEKAVVYENGETVFVTQARLKVMLEQDYLALQQTNVGADPRVRPNAEPLQQIIRDILLPEIEREVNEGENFAQLRQIYHSLILAAWFKRALKENILNKVYVDQNKIAGVDVEDKNVKDKIYAQYLDAFKKGVYDYIKEDYDPATQEIIARKYFSGGFSFRMMDKDKDKDTLERHRMPGSPGALRGFLRDANNIFVGLMMIVGINLVQPGSVQAQPADAQQLSVDALKADILRRSDPGKVISLLSEYYLSRDTTVLEFLVNLDCTPFVNRAWNDHRMSVLALRVLAEEGNDSALDGLISLSVQGYDGKNSEAYATRRNIISDLISLAPAYPRAFGAVMDLAYPNDGGQGDDAARSFLDSNKLSPSQAEYLIKLIAPDRKDLINFFVNYSNRRVLELRQAHLEDRISDDELRRQLALKSLQGHPFLLYVYYTSPENFGDMARMIFDQLTAQAQKEGMDLNSFLKELDPQGVFYKNFILQAANFNMLDDLLATPESLYEVLDLLFKDLSRADIESYSVRLALFLERILQDQNFVYQRDVQEYLRKLYGQTEGLNQYFIAALLSVYQDRLGFLNGDDIAGIAKQHSLEGTAEGKVDYERLFIDSKLTAHLVFADEDAVTGHYKATSQFFQRRGYKLISSTETQIILEKGNVRVVLIDANNQEGYDINEHLTEAGIVSSRSHAGNEDKVFGEAQVHSPGKIFVISSCRSVTTIGHFSNIYRGAEFIGVNGIAEGEKTNVLTYHLLEALSRRISTYEEIGKLVRNGLSQEGIEEDYAVMPGDRSLRVDRIIKENLSAFPTETDSDIPENPAAPAGQGDPAALGVATEPRGSLHIIQHAGPVGNGRSDKEKERHLENQSRAQLNRLKAQFGILPDTHPAVKYLREVMRSLFPEIDLAQLPEINILARRGQGIDAASFPHGSIYLTPELLDSIDTREELIWVILHEFVHFDRKHSQKRSKYSDAFAELGMSRYAEYEADIAALRMMSDRKINSAGGIVMMNKFRQLERFERRIDLVHGDSTDRLLNMVELTQHIAFQGLAYESLEKAPDFLKQIALNSQGNLLAFILEQPEDNFGEGYARRKNLLKTADWILLQQAAQPLYEEWQKLQTIPASRRNTDTQFRLSSLAEMLDTIYARFNQLLDASSTGLTPGEKAIHRYLMFTLGLGLPAQRDTGMGSSRQIHKEFFSLMKDEKILEDIRAILLAEDNVISRAGIFVEGEALREFVDSIAVGLIQAGSFEDDEGAWDTQRYLEAMNHFVDTLEKFNQRQGAFGFNTTDIWSNIVYRGLEEYLTLGMESEAEMAFFLEQVNRFNKRSFSNRLVLEAMNKNKDIRQHVPAFLKLVKETEDSFGTIAGIFHSKSYGNLKVDQFVNLTFRELSAGLRRLYGELSSFNEIEDYQKMILQIVGLFASEKAALRDRSFKNDTERFLFVIHFAKMFSSDKESFSIMLNTIISHYFREIYKHRSVREILEIVETIENNQETVDYFGQPLIEESLNIHREEADELLYLALDVFEEAMLGASQPEEFFELLDTYLKNFRLPPADEDVRRTKDEILTKGRSFSLTPKDHQRLYMLSFFVNDIFVQSNLQNYLVFEMVKNLSFEEAAAVIFEQYPRHPLKTTTRALDHLMEEKARTIEQLEYLEEKMRVLLNLSDKGMEMAGKSVIAEYIEEVLNRNKLEILLAGVESFEGDNRLTRLAFNLWWLANRDKVDFEDIFHYITAEGLTEWSDEAKGAAFSPGDLRDYFYRLTPAEKYILLRKLLAGKKGVLMKLDSRVDFLNHFLGKYLQENPEESDVSGIIQNVLRELLTQAQDDELYPLVNGLLLSRIFIPPGQTSALDPVIENFVKEEYSRLMDAVPPDMRASEKLEPIYKRAMAQRIKNMIDTPTYKGLSESEKFLLGLIPENFLKTQAKKLSPIELSLEMAQMMGSAGVRFLQLLGQYIEIPEEYRAKFEEVYDRMKGQSKLAAYLTLKQIDPEYVKQIADISPRIGGGSLVTVYEVLLKDGSHEVIKILNPNASYHAARNIKLLKAVLAQLAQDDRNYARVMPLLDDLEKWIQADIHDERFPVLDLVFREHNQGFQPQGFNHKIYVPRSIGEPSEYLKREEFVAGENLTTFLPKAAEARKKEIVSLVVRNYFHQLIGDLTRETVVVHSDVHPGNIRVMPDGQVAILDRNFYLEFDQNDRQWLLGFFQPKSPQEHLVSFIDYLAELPENRAFKTDDRRRQLEKAASPALDSSKELDQWVMDMVTKLKEQGLHVPLKITLLMKNLNALNKMAKTADFADLFEAAMWNPSQSASAPTAGDPAAIGDGTQQTSSTDQTATAPAGDAAAVGDRRLDELKGLVPQALRAQFPDVEAMSPVEQALFEAKVEFRAGNLDQAIIHLEVIRKKFADQPNIAARAEYLIRSAKTAQKYKVNYTSFSAEPLPADIIELVLQGEARIASYVVARQDHPAPTGPAEFAQVRDFLLAVLAHRDTLLGLGTLEKDSVLDRMDGNSIGLFFLDVEERNVSADIKEMALAAERLVDDIAKNEARERKARDERWDRAFTGGKENVKRIADGLHSAVQSVVRATYDTNEGSEHRLAAAVAQFHHFVEEEGDRVVEFSIRGESVVSGGHKAALAAGAEELFKRSNLTPVEKTASMALLLEGVQDSDDEVLDAFRSVMGEGDAQRAESFSKNFLGQDISAQIRLIETQPADPTAPAGQGDPAAVGSEAPGGIDFSKWFNIEIQRDENGVPLPLTPAQIQNIHLDGLTPVIINIQPMPSLPAFLGLVEKPVVEEISHLAK